MRENGGVIIVAPAAEIAAREKADLEARKEIRRARAADLRVRPGQLRQGLRPGRTDEGVQGQLAAVRAGLRGHRRADQHAAGPGRGRADRCEIRRLVSTLDIPVRQVLIESRIVVVRDDFSRSLGIRWGVTPSGEGRRRPDCRHGLRQGTNTIVNSGHQQHQQHGTAVPGDQLPAQGDRYNVNLPVANPAGRLALACWTMTSSWTSSSRPCRPRAAARSCRRPG
jgi:type IV pilus assembly protein PilQ